MDHRSPERAPATPSTRRILGAAEITPLMSIMARFGEAARAESDAVMVRRAVERAISEAEDLGDWSHQVHLIGKQLGLRLSVLRWTIREAAAHADHDHPVALRALSEAASEPWVLVEKAGIWRTKVRLGSSGKSVRMSYRALARALGAAHARAEIDALTSQPLTPWEGSHAAAEAHGGEHGTHAGSTPMARLMRLAAPERDDLWKILLFAAATGILALATPLTVDAVVNFVAFGGVLQPLIALVVVLFGCLTLSAAMRALQFYLAELIQRRLFVRMASDLAYRLPRVRRDALDEEHTPEIVNRFFAVSTLQKTASTILLDGINLVLSGTIGLVILGFYHPILLAFDVVMILAVCLVLFLVGRGAVRTSIEDSEAMYRAVGWLEEMGRVPMAFRTPLAAQLGIDRADRATHVYISARARHFRILFRQKIGALALQVIGSTALLGIGGQLVMQGTLTLGQLVAAEIIVTVILGSISKFGKQLEAWYDILAAVDKLGHLMDLPLERESGESHAIPGPGGSVELHEVTFEYHAGRPVIDGVSLSIPGGRHVGFDDRYGKGHTTLLELLLGLREPSHGHVLVDGMDVRHWRLDSMRDQIAYVHEDDIIKGTVHENLCMGRNSIRHIEIRAALEAVGLWEDVLALPDGVHCPLLSGGAPLSTTQRLRLVFARALLARPKILLIDGAVDRLGEDERSAVLQAVMGEGRGMTVIVVSQLESVLRRCDEVYVLSHGKLTRSLGEPAARA